MAMEDTESCSSRSVESSSSAASQPKNHHRKLEVYNEVLRRLRASHASPFPSSFEDGLWSHFNRLPARYALDVNVERAEDVLMHKRLLQMATNHANRPVFEVRVVQVPVLRNGIPLNSDAQGEQESSSYVQIGSVHPPPAFGSSPNLEALALEVKGSGAQDGDSVANAKLFTPRRMHEITFSSDDKPKLLSQLTSLLGNIGLNIQEAHAFCTNDGYSLDVFVVEGWSHEETDKLKLALQNEIQKMEKQPSPKADMPPAVLEFGQIDEKKQLDHLQIPSDGADVWEINIKKLKFEKKVASGAYGDLYKGTYCSQDVAIKVLKPERTNADMQKEFSQEVYIMRKVRHKNVVQFIGACTKLPSLCIVTEFMSGGSVYDYLHKHKGVFKISALLRVAIDVSKGMNYLHQNSIIHRDLKAANLLVDENEVVKVADFGVARVKCQSGVMTAETGTYRWMAPEVIEHKPYDHKADVYSFGIVLWELLTGKIPHEYLTPLQAAVGVVQKGLRPIIPKSTHPKLAELLGRCWQQDPNLRPDFSEILETLQGISIEVGNESENHRRERSSSSGFRSILRRSHH